MLAKDDGFGESTEERQPSLRVSEDLLPCQDSEESAMARSEVALRVPLQPPS